MLKYSVNSSLIRLQDLVLIGQILKSQQAVLKLKDIFTMDDEPDQLTARFENFEETYFLFTKLKKDRMTRMPSPDINESDAMRLV